MGCGFSTEDTKASDEERILKSSDVVTTTDTTMGGALAKKSPAKKRHRHGDNKGRDQDPTNSTITSASNGSSSAPLTIQSSTNEVSSSQVNFFKMLDEKIENGFELEEQDSDYERKLQLQRVAEEWDTILGRSQEDSNDPPMRPSEDAIEWVTEANVESSNDSMRTMFSNSVNLQATTAKAAAEGGRLCEVSNNNKSAAMDTASSEAAEVAVPAAAGRPSSALRLRQCQ